jgi:hypothetical protein
MNDELKTVWKEEVVAYLKVLSWHLRGVIEENHKNIRAPDLCTEIRTRAFLNTQQDR